MIRVNDRTVLSYEGMGLNGHWYHDGPDRFAAAREMVNAFGDQPTNGYTAYDAHRKIMIFDAATREELGEEAYKTGGLYPQIAWYALTHAGAWQLLDELLEGTPNCIRVNGRCRVGSLILPAPEFTAAFDTLAGMEIDWGQPNDRLWRQ